MAGDSSGRGLEQTATWAVATICIVIVMISIALEKALHRLGHWFTERRKLAMFHALENIKSELMIMGFISLLLTFGQNHIAKICIPKNIAHTMLPCSLKTKVKEKDDSDNHRLLWENHLGRRILAVGSSVQSCGEDKVPFVSTKGIHDLHIFIFFLAVFHVAYSAATMALGRLKIRRWKQWEKETKSLDYEFSNDPARFRFAHEVSFVKHHAGFWYRLPLLFYISCFFSQFFHSVRKTDYLTMRHGFINVHLAPGSKFDFQKYIKRSLEDDFKKIVGISPALWASAVIFLLVNVKGWQALNWVTIIPLVIVLSVGTKLQGIIATMALEIKERHAVVQGIPLVEPNDKHFWFSSPGLVLFLIHFSLFQNAFQIVYFFWIWYTFGLHSCFHENLQLIIIRVCIGALILLLCSYVTLPLYALVTQMGTNMKKSIFDEETSKALKKWQEVAKKRNARLGRSPSRSAMGSRTPSRTPSPVHVSQDKFFRFKSTGHIANPLPTPRRRINSDQEMSEMERDASPSSSTHLMSSEVYDAEVSEHPDHDNGDFSFGRSKAPTGGI